MKKKEKKSKPDKNVSAYYLELESPLDFARQAFDYTSRHINAIKEGGRYRLVVFGEKLGEVKMVYYVNVDKLSNFFVYMPDAEPTERYEMEERLPGQVDYKSYRAPIVELLSSPYIETKDIKKAGKVIKIEAKDANAFIKSFAGNMHDEESPQKLYAFYDGKSHIIGTFEFFHESARIFTYAKIDIKEKFSMLRYNYTSDSIEPANSFTEKTAIYIRVINLKKPFPFF